MLKTAIFGLTITALLMGSGPATAQTELKRYRRPKIRQRVPNATELSIALTPGLATGINRAAASATLQSRMMRTANAMGLTAHVGATTSRTADQARKPQTEARTRTRKRRARRPPITKVKVTPTPASATTPDWSKVDWSALTRMMSAQ
jgi:hypothetical protein